MTILPKKQSPSREGSDGDSSDSGGEEGTAARTSISWPQAGVEGRHEAAPPPFDSHDGRPELTGRGKRRHLRSSPSHSRQQRPEATGYNSSDEYETSRTQHVAEDLEVGLRTGSRLRMALCLLFGCATLLMDVNTLRCRPRKISNKL